MCQQYANRNIMALDRAGNYYCLHVAAMTAEKLHDKSDIAAELAQRDYDNAQLKSELQRLSEATDALVGHTDDITCQHESTHRGGTLWEICDECGAKWADDQGGKPDVDKPKAVAQAEAAIQRARVLLDSQA